MTTINDGGPAFARPASDHPARDEWYPAYRGMTLLDYFAGKAAQGMLADPNLKATPTEFALRAYALADAMLEVRQEFYEGVGNGIGK